MSPYIHPALRDKRATAVWRAHPDTGVPALVARPVTRPARAPPAPHRRPVHRHRRAPQQRPRIEVAAPGTMHPTLVVRTYRDLPVRLLAA